MYKKHLVLHIQKLFLNIYIPSTNLFTYQQTFLKFRKFFIFVSESKEHDPHFRLNDSDPNCLLFPCIPENCTPKELKNWLKAGFTRYILYCITRAHGKT